MRLPAYWWLLAVPVVIQGAFFVQAAVSRLRGRVFGPSGLVSWTLYASCLAGLGYGVVQRDPVFGLGQVFLAIVFLQMRRAAHRAENSGAQSSEGNERA
jgi:hypothetical protein